MKMRQCDGLTNGDAKQTDLSNNNIGYIWII